MENVGCAVSKAYLQHERHSHIHYDNDDQCHAPVVGNTHNLRGAGRALNATSHTHGFHQHHATIVTPSLSFQMEHIFCFCCSNLTTFVISFRETRITTESQKNGKKTKFTSRKLSMAGTGYSMMKRRKVYRPMQDSKNGPEEIKKYKYQHSVKPD